MYGGRCGQRECTSAMMDSGPQPPDAASCNRSKLCPNKGTLQLHTSVERLSTCAGALPCVCVLVFLSALLTPQEVMDHARWHMDLVDLDARKRAALERWRAAKQQQRAALAAQEAALFSDTSKQVSGTERVCVCVGGNPIHVKRLRPRSSRSWVS